jgi:two-component system cell cycle sensor histidine kinase/response regulator CckA
MGTGLGLASAYGIIKNHNGFINCYSELGHGTTFNVYFPVCEEVYPPEDGGADGELVEGVPGGDETILFVDDDEEIITVGRKILASLGYTVLVASGGQAAVDLFIDQRDRIALVILDYVMPGMGGREVFDALKQIQPDVKFLLSSGYSSTDQVAALIEKGCRGFIQKPYDTVKMSRTIRTILDGEPLHAIRVN